MHRLSDGFVMKTNGSIPRDMVSRPNPESLTERVPLSACLPVHGVDAASGGTSRSRRLPCLSLIALAVMAVLSITVPAAAQDPEGCLTCHRYQGLAWVDPKTKLVNMFYVDPNYYERALGPHSRLLCSQCHPRAEVEVVPHEKVTPVNCSQACHVIGAEGLEITFSHDRIAGMLEDSVHNKDILQTTNTLLGSPLQPNQSRCLLCHDEPRFRRGIASWIEQTAPVDRCNVCHNETLPVNTTYFYWHVFARSRPAHSHPETVRICGVCHHNAAINEHFKLPDTISSYLFSFHGKAMMLGSDKTAACLNCHVGKMQNVHVMKSATDPNSPIYPTHLADTCRSPACHALAGANVSNAAVHLQLSGGFGIEYIVALIFIGMIVFTFGPSLMLSALEMLHIGIGREDPSTHTRLVTVEHMLDNPRGRNLLSRFNLHQRFQHWTLVALFATLVVTGFPLKFADRPWAADIIGLIGSVDIARRVHRIAGLLLIFGLLYHLLYVGTRIFRKARREGVSPFKALATMPLAVTPYDMGEMTHLVLYLLGIRKTRPLQGRFSMPEKFEYFGVFWGTVLLGVTGLLMWHSDWTTRYMSGRILTLAFLIHGFEAFLALLHVGVVHMVSVIFSPAVLPASPAMFNGLSPAEELAEQHPAWVDQAKKELEAESGPTGGQS